MNSSSEHQSAESDLALTAEFLRALLARFTRLLGVHCSGPLYWLIPDIDELYIHLLEVINNVLATEGFEELRDAFPKSVPDSLHELGDEADWYDEGIKIDLNRFTGATLRFCVRVGAGRDELARQVFDEQLKNYDVSITRYEEHKDELTKEWMSKRGLLPPPPESSDSPFVSPERLKELKALASQNFDLSKLVRLCEELNISAAHDCHFAVGMLLRAIADHLPPLFGCKSFGEVANNYSGGSKSFKDSMKHLDQSLRKIADSYLHTQIRAKEVLPNRTQVNFQTDLDVLLGEVVRILK